MLSVGDILFFEVCKTFELDEEHFVVLKCDSEQYSLNANDYKGYSFNIGDKIKCRVDKINCSGKIFFEPEHPYYKEQNFYFFQFLRVIDREERNSIIEVLDRFGNIHQCKTSQKELESGQSIKLWLQKISKGQFYLFDSDSEIPNNHSKGDVYSAPLIIDSNCYLVWKDKKIFIDTSLYPWLDKHSGQIVSFFVQHYDLFGNPIIEIVHDDFLPGKKIWVKALREVTFPAGKSSTHHMIECIAENNIKVYLSHRFLATWKPGDRYFLQVDTVKKGRILLKPINQNES